MFPTSATTPLILYLHLLSLTVILCRGFSFPSFFQPRPQLTLPTCSCGSGRSSCFSSEGGAADPQRRTCGLREVRQPGYPIPLLLSGWENRGICPVGQVNSSSHERQPFSHGRDFSWLCLHSGMALAKVKMSTSLVIKSLLLIRINSAGNH